MPAVCADYCFVCRDPLAEAEADAEDEETSAGDQPHLKKEKATILDSKGSETGCVRAHWVPNKGIADVPWIAKEVNKDLAIWGHGNCIFKSDQEPSMQALFDAISKLRDPFRLIPELAPNGDSQSYGLLKRANRSVKGQVRMILLSLEA